jgi:hypothetical protein
MTASIAKTVDKMKNLMDKLAAFLRRAAFFEPPGDLNRMLGNTWPKREVRPGEGS